MDLLAQGATEGLLGGVDATEAVVFLLFGGLALGSGIAVITLRNMVHAALMLVLNFLAIAVLYVTLESQFLGIIQVLVYAGAIMVLFLFVIMLLGVQRDDLLPFASGWARGFAVVAGAVLAGVLLFGLGPYLSTASVCGAQDVTGSAGAVPCRGLQDQLAAIETGPVGFLAERMFTRYTWPFELAAVLLTVATIGAVVLGRRRDPEPEQFDAPPVEEPPAEPSLVAGGDLPPAEGDGSNATPGAEE